MSEVLSYADEVHGIRGWLALDSTGHGLAVGGCRVQSGLTAQRLSTLASRMTLKQRVLGIPVSGAKCGLDLDPGRPCKADVLARFVAFLAPLLHTRLSLGCDMGTTWSELETAAHRVGVPSVKYAVKVAQGLTDEEFQARIRLLDQPVGRLTLGQRRAGHALAHAALAVVAPARPDRGLTCAIQGFGTLGRAAAYTLAEAGVDVVAIADEHGCVSRPQGLDVAGMLGSALNTPVPRLAVGASRRQRAEIFSIPADVVILAANQDSIDIATAGRLPASAVVVGANCGLSAAAEAVLDDRGIPVVPDFIGGIGGSASMECLFGPPLRPTAPAVLDSVAGLMHRLLADLRDRARRQATTLGGAAMAVAAEPVPENPSPYGGSRYTITAGHVQLVPAGES